MSLSSGCCGVRGFGDEAKALRMLDKLAGLRVAGGDGDAATWSAATEAYECWNHRWHLRPADDGTLTAAVAARPRDTGPDAKTRAAVYKRDGFRCVCCGTSVIGLPHSVGHRMRRAQGGTNDPPDLLTFLGLGNGLMGDDLDHHHRIDSRIDPADETAGYTLRSRQNPLLIPVLYVTEWGSQEWTWLTSDGHRVYEAPAGAAA